MTLDQVTGVLSGTPTQIGNFTFTTDVSDIANGHVSKIYNVTIAGDLAPPTYTIATSVSPANGGTASGDGVYNQGDNVTVTAVPNPGFAFANWTEIKVFSEVPSYSFTATGNRALVANFVPAPMSVGSHKTHGTAGDLNIDLPLIGSPGVECRKGQGATADQHQVVFTFGVPITLNGVPTVSVSAPAGGTPGATASVNGSVVTVDLTGILNAQTITITLTNVNGAGPVSIPMSILLGDTNQDGAVNSGDISQVKSQSGQVVNAANLREDLNIDGSINSADISLVKSKSGTALPLLPVNSSLGVPSKKNWSTPVQKPPHMSRPVRGGPNKS
jgi:hypothetical protein